MSNWTIKVLYFGYTAGQTPDHKEWAIPWLGYYLTDGRHKVLCDTGVKDGFFKDGKSPFGLPSEGDESFVLQALDGIKVKPGEMDLVIYTHFHWDHVGNCHLFPQAVHVFQDQEYKELLDPLPSMQFLTVYDQRVIPELQKLKCQRVSGDAELLDGLELIHAPGHSAGGQCLRVKTKAGTYVITGDLFNTYLMAYPETEEWYRLDGTRTTLDPEARKMLFSSFIMTVYDHYAWYRSQYRIKAMAPSPEYLLPSHDAKLLGRTFG
ncbi:MAG: N-acyl homoserine lactonase family protein [Pseudomonadota bacterium]